MTERRPNRKPAFAILVEGGIVQSVVAAREHLVYRLIDVDGARPEDWMIGDATTDAAGVDIDVFTHEAIASRSILPHQSVPDAHLEDLDDGRNGEDS